VIWDVEFDSKEAADGFQAAALDYVSAMEAGAGENISLSEKRHFRISRPSPVRVRFLNTATKELMGKFD
jgi:hypothetical protein